MCAQQRLWSVYSDQPGHPPSLISLRCLHEESLGPEVLLTTLQRLIRLRRCPSWSSVGPHSNFVCFVMRWLIISRTLMCLCENFNCLSYVCKNIGPWSSVVLIQSFMYFTDISCCSITMTFVHVSGLYNSPSWLPFSCISDKVFRHFH